MPPKILNIAVPAPELSASLAKSLSISPRTCQLLVNRGIRSAPEARDFLAPGLHALHDPFSFKEMSLAVNLVKKAARQGDPVLIFSDYDVDGVTSVAVLGHALSKLGVAASHYIPHRVKEGYGLSGRVFELVEKKGIKLVITADCGTNSVEIISELRGRGVEVIVTDHHEPSYTGDHPASALINPKNRGESYPYRELAGVGVAFKFGQAMTGERLPDELDLVSLGTIADSVPLTGENRVFAKEGMARIGSTRRPGLRGLMEVAGMAGKEVSAGSVNFILAPRINASGRMDTAERALQLLLCREEARAQELAKELDLCNRQRQKTEAKILEEAQAIIDREVNFKEHKVIVVAKEGWHAGCLGIVASKLADRFYRPAILITRDEKGRFRGSGRSVGKFHLFNGLAHCSSLLESYGGHEHAVGMSIAEENISEFRNRLNRFAFEKLTAGDLIPSIEIDMELGLDEITREFIAELELLEPFGEGNPEPLFYSKGLAVKGQSRVFARQALKFWVTDGSRTFPAIAFGQGALKESLDSSSEVQLVYRPKIDSWQGMESVILEVKEIFLK